MLDIIPTLMKPSNASIAAALLILAACGGDLPQERMPEALADPVDPGTRIVFSGQVLLEGSLAHEVRGAIHVSVRPIGGTRPILERSYELADPWRTRNSIPFGLSPADQVAEGEPRYARRMSLLVSYDADGIPDTRSSEDVQVQATVATGATDIAVSLRRDEPEGPRAARAGEK